MHLSPPPPSHTHTQLCYTYICSVTRFNRLPFLDMTLGLLSSSFPPSIPQSGPSSLHVWIPAVAPDWPPCLPLTLLICSLQLIFKHRAQTELGPWCLPVAFFPASPPPAPVILNTAGLCRTQHLSITFTHLLVKCFPVSLLGKLLQEHILMSRL